MRLLLRYCARTFLDNCALNALTHLCHPTILQHPQLVQITTDSDLIRTVVMESKVVYLDGDDSVRAIVKPEQNTLILRDLPSGTKLDDVIGIFERAKEPGSSSADITPVGVRSDMMDTWCVLVAVVWLPTLLFPFLVEPCNPSNAPLSLLLLL